METALITASFAVLGVIITQLYTRNNNLRAELKGDKHEIYSEFIEFLFKVMMEDFEGGQDEITRSVKNFMPKLMTYGSDDVVKNAGDFMQHFYNPNEADPGRNSVESLKVFGDLVVSIRNDLGHKKFNSIMKWHDITRIWIRDIDKYLPDSERTPRGKHTGPDPVFSE